MGKDKKKHAENAALVFSPIKSENKIESSEPHKKQIQRETAVEKALASSSEQVTQTAKAVHEILSDSAVIEEFIEELEKFSCSTKKSRSIDFDKIEVRGITGQALKAAYKKLRVFCIRAMTIDVELRVIKSQYKNILKHGRRNRYKGFPTALNDKPKSPLSSYVLFCMKIREKISKKHPGINQAELLHMFGAKWQKMSDEEKQPYIDEATRLKVEYLKDLEEYYKKHPEMKPQAKAKNVAKKSTGKPTAITASFELFFSDWLKKTEHGAAESSNAAREEEAFTQFFKLSPEDRHVWDDKAKKLRESKESHLKPKAEKFQLKQANQKEEAKSGKSPDKHADQQSAGASNHSVKNVEAAAKRRPPSVSSSSTTTSSSESDEFVKKQAPKTLPTKQVVQPLANARNFNKTPLSKPAVGTSSSSDDSSSSDEDQKVKKAPAKLGKISPSKNNQKTTTLLPSQPKPAVSNAQKRKSSSSSSTSSSSSEDEKSKRKKSKKPEMVQKHSKKKQVVKQNDNEKVQLSFSSSHDEDDSDDSDEGPKNKKPKGTNDSKDFPAWIK